MRYYNVVATMEGWLTILIRSCSESDQHGLVNDGRTTHLQISEVVKPCLPVCPDDDVYSVLAHKIIDCALVIVGALVPALLNSAHQPTGQAGFTNFVADMLNDHAWNFVNQSRKSRVFFEVEQFVVGGFGKLWETFAWLPLLGCWAKNHRLRLDDLFAHQCAHFQFVERAFNCLLLIKILRSSDLGWFRWTASAEKSEKQRWIRCGRYRNTS